MRETERACKAAFREQLPLQESKTKVIEAEKLRCQVLEEPIQLGGGNSKAAEVENRRKATFREQTLREESSSEALDTETPCEAIPRESRLDQMLIDATNTESWHEAVFREQTVLEQSSTSSTGIPGTT